MAGPYFPGYVTKGDFSRIASSAEHELGTLGFSAGRILQYVKHGAGSARYNWVGLDITATGADAAHTVVVTQPNGTHAPIGVAEYGATVSNYGWVTRFGGATAKVNATTAKGVGLSNYGAATGTLTNPVGETYLRALRGYGVVVGSPSVSGTYVQVNCL